MKRRRSTKRKPSNRISNQAKWLDEEEISQTPDNVNFGRDLMFEILVRLPIKCLLRFKSVSKYWFRLISSPEFIKFRLQYACDDPCYTHHRLLQIDRYYVVIFRQAPLLPTLRDPESFYRLETGIPQPMEFSEDESYPFALKFVGSCSGMVCMSSCNHRVIVWNPALRKCKRLPYFGRGSDVFYGFGYDKSSGDFKVVGIRNTPKTLVKIYSARTNSWKKLQDDNFEVGWVDSHGCFLNGKLHWATKNKSIFIIDLASERFGVMDPPDSVHVQECCAWNIYAVGEFLAVFCFYIDRSRRSWTQDADFFMMEPYGVKETWTKVNNGMTTLQDCYVVYNVGHMLHRHAMYVTASEPGEAWWTIPIPGHMTSNAIKAFLLYSLKRADYPFDNPREFFLYFNSHPQREIVYVESLIWPFLSVSK